MCRMKNRKIPSVGTENKIIPYDKQIDYIGYLGITFDASCTPNVDALSNRRKFLHFNRLRQVSALGFCPYEWILYFPCEPTLTKGQINGAFRLTRTLIYPRPFIFCNDG